MTSRDLDDKAIVRRKPEAPQIRLIRQAKQRVKLGLDFEGVTLESLAKDMPELKAGRIEEAVIVQLNQYFQQLASSLQSGHGDGGASVAHLRDEALPQQPD